MNSVTSKRKHVGIACQSCRDSKIRCDGVRPVCGGCSRKDKECQYTLKDDKRRVSLRTAIDILSGRVGTLTDALISHGVPVPPLDAQQELALNDICETLRIPLPTMLSREEADLTLENEVPAPTVTGTNVEMWNSNVAGLETLRPPGFQLQDDDPHIEGPSGSVSGSQDCFSMSGPLTDGTMTDWPWHVFESNAFLLSEPVFPTNLEGDYVTVQRDQEPVTAQIPINDSVSDLRGSASSDDEHESDLVQQVSTRFGALRISADGQLRYFGAATNYHLLEGSRHDEDIEFFTTKHEMLDRLGQAGLNQEIPNDLEEHLLQLYFAWHNPSHVTVDRGAFNAARTKETASTSEAGYASDFLVNAM